MDLTGLKPKPLRRARDWHHAFPVTTKQVTPHSGNWTRPLINPPPLSRLPLRRALPAAGALGSAPLEPPPTSSSAGPARVRERTFVRRFESPPLGGYSPTSGRTSAAARTAPAARAEAGRPAPSRLPSSLPATPSPREPSPSLARSAPSSAAIGARPPALGGFRPSLPGLWPSGVRPSR